MLSCSGDGWHDAGVVVVDFLLKVEGWEMVGAEGHLGRCRGLRRGCRLRDLRRGCRNLGRGCRNLWRGCRRLWRGCRRRSWSPR
jgi:hypothetical protein